MKKTLFLALGLLSLLDIQAYRRKRVQQQEPKEFCGRDEKSCKDLSNPCQCYCAYKGAPRDKTADDKPIFIENDPSEIYCYCKQRDIDKHNADLAAQEGD